MTRRMRTSKAGLELIMSFEGFRTRATALPDGTWMIGYGHTKAAKEGLRMTPADGEAVLREYDLPRFEKAISDLVMAPLNQNEFDALVSFVFNIGGRAFANSRVLTLLNAGERLTASDAMSAWRKALLNGRLIVVDALVRRRAAEVALFLKSPSGNPIASSVMVRPVLDERLKRYADIAPVAARIEAPDPVPERAPARTRDLPDLPSAPLARPNDARLTRVLGETEPAFSPGPTPDEITRAISALAKGEDLPPVALERPRATPPRANGAGAPLTNLTTGNDPLEDLPPLPRFVMNGDDDETGIEIDDLEEASVNPDVVARAIKNADVAEPAATLPARPAVIARIGLGVVGLVLASFGLTRIMGGIDVTGADNIAQFMSVGSLVFGVCFIVLALYLGFRAASGSMTDPA